MGEHTAGVMVILLALTDGKASRDLLLHALFHDFAEQRTGDVPFPFKRDTPDVKERLDQAELSYLEELGIELPFLSPDEYQLLKAADMLQLCYKAKTEIAMGNTLAHGILANGLSYLAGLQLAGTANVRLKNLVGDVKWTQQQQGNPL